MVRNIVAILLLLLSLNSCKGCVQFRNAGDSLTSTEANGFVEACVELTSPPTSAGTVTLMTSVISATAADFVSVDKDLMVPMGQTTDICFNITINPDNEIEQAEIFTLGLSSNDIAVCTQNTMVAITIMDSTRLRVRYQESSYVRNNEQGRIEVCLVVDPGSIVTRDVSFTPSTVAGLGTAGIDDFVFFPSPITINMMNIDTPQCRMVTVSTDDIIESNEFIFLGISTQDAVDLVGEFARVTFTDDDEAEVSLVDQFVSVSEGNSGPTNINMCIRLDSTAALERDVVIIINTVSNTATPGDYEEVIDGHITIPSASSMGHMVCGVIVVNGDLINEEDETFEVELRANNSEDTVLTQTFSVTILDDGDTIADCGNLDNPINGEVMISPNTFENSIASYSCFEGYDLVGDATRTCLSTETWSLSAPLCQIVDCNNLASPMNGMVEVTTTTFLSTATYSCNEGRSLVASSGEMVASSSIITTCQADGVWSVGEPTCIVIDCESLPDPPNGMVTQSSTTFGAEADYSCDDGYMIVGGATPRVCEGSGNWSGSAPSCQFITCDVLTDPDNGGVTFTNSNSFGSTASYSCMTGYQLDGGMDERTCGSNGEWSGEAPACNMIMCESLTSPSNGDIRFSAGLAFNSVATYTCHTGHELSGPHFNRTCLESAMWSNSAPTCNALDCGDLPDISGGSVSFSSTTSGSTAAYACNDDFTLIGTAVRGCASNGIWNSSEPSCNNLNPVVSSSETSQSVSPGNSIIFNCTVLNISDALIPSVEITWLDLTGQVIEQNNGTLFLELELTDLESSDSGNYTCNVTVNSSGVSETSAVFLLTVEGSTSSVVTEGLGTQSSDTILIVAIVLGIGAAIVIIICIIGALVICSLCLRKKKNYRKYVLPYRMYMYSNKGTSNPSNRASATDSDIRQWENARKEHVVDAVDILEKRRSMHIM